MHDRLLLSPRPHLTPQPHTALILPNAELPVRDSPSTVSPPASVDPFAQARRLWGQLLLKVHQALSQENQ
jgi:hypothetical protein